VRRALVGVAVAASALLAGGAGAGTSSRALTPFPDVNFISACGFSHRAPDDPIVYPGRPGLSHDHTFIGNVSTNAWSSLDTLRVASTTCTRDGDTAAYWAPTLVDNGTPVTPIGADVYYRRRTFARVQPFPAGLKMVAGNSHAVSPQLLDITWWDCGSKTDVAAQSTVPTCPSGRNSSLRLHVRFPNCWDGKHLDSRDHKSHMAYSVGGACPARHPVAVPSLAIALRYPIMGDSSVYLASGGQFSGHADFINAWNQDRLAFLVNDCLNAARHCGLSGQ
jgi:uncharacterized protein DUF1996